MGKRGLFRIDSLFWVVPKNFISHKNSRHCVDNAVITSAICNSAINVNKLKKSINLIYQRRFLAHSSVRTVNAGSPKKGTKIAGLVPVEV